MRSKRNTRWSYASWVAVIGRWHRAIVAVSAILALASAWSLTRLRLDIDLLGMLPRGTAEFDDFRVFVGDFGQLDELLLILDGAPMAELQRFAGVLAPRLAALDTVASVQDRVDAERLLDGLLGPYLFNYLPADAFAEVKERLTPAGIEAAVAADRAILSAPFDLSAARHVAADPLGLRRLAAERMRQRAEGALPASDAGYLAARDGTALLLLVHPIGSPFDAVFVRRLLGGVAHAVEETERDLAGSGVRVRTAGSYAFASEDEAAFRADLTRYVVLGLIGVLAVFLLGYGNLRILPFVTYPLVVTALATFALSLFLYDQLNAVSLSFAAILYGLSIDSGIHFYSRLLAEIAVRRGSGGGRPSRGELAGAIAATLAGLGRANVAGSATTAAAFAVIGFSALGAVRQLGVLTAIGMGLTVVEFFTLYPALGFMLGGRCGTLGGHDSVRLARWAAASARRGKVVRGAMVAAALVFGAAALHVRLDPGLERLRPGDTPARRVLDEIAARFGAVGGSGAVLVRRGGAEPALADGERVAALLRDYRQRGLIGRVQSVDALLPSVEEQERRLALYGALPRDASLEALRESLLRQGFDPARFASFFAAFGSPRRAVVRPGDPILAPLAPAIERHLRRYHEEAIVAVYVDPADGVGWPALAAQLRADLAGLPVAIAARPLLEHQLGFVLRQELALFLVLAFGGNLLLLAVILRDVRLAAAVLAPVALVVLALFAGMWLAGVPLDPVNLVVPPLILGLGVDDGVYVASAVRQCGEIGAAVRATGRAMTMTSLTTITGFGFLAFSDYPPLAGLGSLAAAGLALSLAATILLLPALLPRRAPITSGI